jgi:hypothetical protein
MRSRNELIERRLGDRIALGQRFFVAKPAVTDPLFDADGGRSLV